MSRFSFRSKTSSQRPLRSIRVSMPTQEPRRKDQVVCGHGVPCSHDEPNDLRNSPPVVKRFYVQAAVSPAARRINAFINRDRGDGRSNA